MTMIDVDEAEKAAHEACTCHNDPCDGCVGVPNSPCSLEACIWPGHAAIRDLRSAAFEAGLEAAAKIADKHAAVLSAPEGQQSHEAFIAQTRSKAIASECRSLAAKEASDE